MEQTYQYLLSLEFRHNYFKDGLFRSIQVSFDEVTMQLTKNLGIIIKPYPGGVHLLCLDPTLLNTATESTALRLFLECNDPYYINYSELGNYSPSEELLYFNNLATLPDGDGTALKLHNEAYVGQIDSCKLSTGEFTVSEVDSTKSYQFIDQLGYDVSNKVRASNSIGTFLISNLPQGMIRILVDGVERERVYYNPNSVWKKPLGIVELFVSQLFETYQQNGKQAYALNFKTRKTIWKYFLADPAYRKFNNLRIISDTQERIFGPPVEEEVSDSKALMFESKEALPLLEYSDAHFKLIDEGEPNPKVVITALPLPSPEQLHYGDRKTVYSHIYL